MHRNSVRPRGQTALIRRNRRRSQTCEPFRKAVMPHLPKYTAVISQPTPTPVLSLQARPLLCHPATPCASPLQVSAHIALAGAVGGQTSGGLLLTYCVSGDVSALGRPLEGPGTGRSDSIPAVIDGGQPAALSDGEFVIPARIVSELGNGRNPHTVPTHY